MLCNVCGFSGYYFCFAGTRGSELSFSYFVVAGKRGHESIMTLRAHPHDQHQASNGEGTTGVSVEACFNNGLQKKIDNMV